MAMTFGPVRGLARRPADQRAPSPRAVAVGALHRVIGDGRSLEGALDAQFLRLQGHDADRGLAQELVYGVLRWYWSLAAVADRYLERSPRRRDLDLYLLILVGLYQLRELRTPPHAAVAATVSVCEELGKAWAKGWVNAILRRSQRNDHGGATASGQARWSHPDWLLERLRHHWPGYWQQVVDGNNQRPPMTLRVNRQRTDRVSYLEMLAGRGLEARMDPRATHAVVLERPTDVDRLPGFANGMASVQDVAAQFVAPLLETSRGMRVLDACAAPGGKSAHILECRPDVQLDAMDIDPDRCELTRATLSRLGLTARVLCADASAPEQWWDGQPYDRILIDAPCSGTGVIRRHPDIKHLRKPEDFVALRTRQRSLLDALWPLLAPGGRLVYVTCSIMPEENEMLLRDFLVDREDAVSHRCRLPAGRAGKHGVQTLPGVDDLDGFYYAVVERRDAAC